jgi:sugar O-acyltransferase (sialic acid O-acetyltransferase NeuD family)
MMSVRKIFVYGASGHGKVVADILLARKDSEIAGFIDDRAELLGTVILGLPVCGNGQWLQEQAGKIKVAIALGIGDNSARQKVAEKCVAWGAELMTPVHPTAAVSASARLGPGTVVMAQASINPDAKIGRGAIVNTGAIVDHDVEIGDFAHVAPNAAMGGASRLGNLSQLSMGATIIQCVFVGQRTVVGAGAVVVRNIPDDVVAFGVPARIQKELLKTQ